MTPKGKDCHRDADIAVLQTNNANMAERMTKLEDTVKEGFDKIDKKLDEIKKESVTRPEHDANVTNIRNIQDNIAGINLKIAVATGVFSAIIFIIERIWK